MKIACQACQAKYTIADEKVLGKIVKIRCKKCGATIVINGTEDANAASAQPAYDYAQQGGEPWTVSVADGDQRTMTPHEIVDAFQQGVVNDETYCWKDGMPDWLPLRDIPEIFSLVGAQPAPQDVSLRSMASDDEATVMAPSPAAAAAAAAAPAAAAAAAAAPSAPPPAAGAGYSTPYAGGNGGGAGGMFGAAEAATDQTAPAAVAAARRQGGRGAAGADLFGSAAAAGGDEDAMSHEPADHGAGAQKLTGERNESSVLFSLSALTQNAPQAPQEANSEGSGIIDIRALSQNMGQSDAAGPKHVDDIMNLGGGGAFSAALAAPVLAPPPVDVSDFGGAGQKKSNIGMIVGLGLAAIIIVGGAVSAAAYFALKKDTTETQPTATVVATSGNATATAATGPGTALAMNDTSSTPTSTAAAPGTGTTTGGGNVKPPVTGGGNVKPPVTGGGTRVVPPPPPPASGGCCPGESEMQCTMRKAAGQPCPAAAANTGGGGGSAPFDRGAAAGALGSVNLASCKKADGPTGSGHVKVTFESNGAVSKVDVDQPPFAGTAVGGCVAGKFRGAKIPAFSGGSMTVGKSFSLN